LIFYRLCLVQAQIVEVERHSADKTQLISLYCGISVELLRIAKSDSSFYLDLVGNRFKQYFHFYLYYSLSWALLYTGLSQEGYVLVLPVILIGRNQTAAFEYFKSAFEAEKQASVTIVTLP
jgi:hypothetical protein